MEIKTFLEILRDLRICEKDTTDDGDTYYEFQVDQGWASFSGDMRDLPENCDVEYWEPEDKEGHSSIYFVFKRNKK